MARLPAHRGFTLIELIIVIVLLGVLSTATFAYLGFGAQIFTDVIGRDQLASQSRFAVERLTRELRNSLPGSARVINEGRCLEFLPLQASSSYLQIPAPGNSDADFIAVPPAQYASSTEYVDSYLFVYANSLPRIYGSSAQRKVIDTVTESGDTLIFDYSTTPRQFPLQSPARRYYVSRGPVSWCLELLDSASNEHRLVRVDNYSLSNSPDLYESTARRTVMATHLFNNLVNNELPFLASGATLQRNNLIELDFRFARRQGAEPLLINHEVHVPNVP